MRVSELTKQNAVQRNMNQSSEELQNVMVGISSGKKLLKPSDDPVGAAKVQDFHTSINHSRTLEKNISADKIWLDGTEESIKQITETLKHVKKLALEGSNGAATHEFRKSLASEVELIANDLVKLGNKREGKLYIFSGTKTFTKPLEMRPKILESDVTFFGTRIKSSEKVIPLDQDSPMTGIDSGTFTIGFKKNEGAMEAEAGEMSAEDEEAVVGEEAKPNEIVITLNGHESLKEIVAMINEAAIADQEYQEDPHSPTGYKARVYAEIGVDNAVYLDPASGISLEFGEDTTGFLKQMNFGAISGTTDENAELSEISTFGIDTGMFEAVFNGYSKSEYLVRVIKGGTFGIAQFVVSDDGGRNWSPTRLLQKTNEIFNPEGKASNKVRLDFGVPGSPYFKEGLEFQFGGNEFVKYCGNEQTKDVLVDNGIKVALNINAKQLFSQLPDDDETVNVFDLLNRIKEALEDDDQTAVMKSIEDVNKAINQVLKRRSEIGSIFKELEASEERIEKSFDLKSEELSKLEDMDLAKGAVDLNSAELKHKVALDSTARLIQPTLINFLR